jgi:ATP adenylyltransferase
VTEGKGAPACVLCAALERPDDEASLVVHVGRGAFLLMNLYPYTSGHAMIAPRRHLARLSEATAEELGEIMELARRVETVYDEVYKPEGLNVGMNLGRVAGAGVPGHLHLHVVPRWTGDTNFMTAVAGTRVIPEDPREACRRLRPYFA